MKGFSSQQTDCIHTFQLKFELIFTYLQFVHMMEIDEVKNTNS